MSIDSNITRLFNTAQGASSSALEALGRIGGEKMPTIRINSPGYSPTGSSRPMPQGLGDMIEDEAHPATVDFLNSQAEQWLNRYFPELQNCMRSQPEQWLCDIITGKAPLGMSQDVFDAVWQQARDREYRARNSATEQLRAEYSSRGFRLPPGAMIASINQAEEAASDAIANVNVMEAIKDAEIKLDLLKFAVEQAAQLKLGIFRALADFYRQWSSTLDKNYEASRIKVQAYQSLNSALASYYQTELGFEKLRLDAAELRMRGEISEKDLQARLYTSDNKNQAFGQAVRGFADIAASAASAAGTLQANIFTADQQ